MPLLRRAVNANKSHHGGLVVVGGAQGTVGAALLSARTAVYSGTGRVFLARPDLSDHFLVDVTCPEVMIIAFKEAAAKPVTAWAIGPGLGLGPASAQIMAQVLHADLPVVIDADALNLIALDPALGRQCARRSAPTILTPHEGEAARLLKKSTAEIAADRPATAFALQKAFGGIVLLKGHQSLITDGPGHLATNQSGNAALATGGTGDVLTGLIGSLLAQGLAPFKAACWAADLHGRAAESLTKRHGGMIGLAAGELILEIRALINHAEDLG